MQYFVISIPPSSAILATKLLACVFLFLINATAFALDFSIGKPPGKSQDAILISGEIRTGDTERFRQFITENADSELKLPVHLDSPGGNLAEALELAKLLRDLLQDTEVFKPAHCVSACFFLYLAGTHRTAFGPPHPTLGIHRPYISPEITRGLPLHQAEAVNRKIYDRAESWLKAERVPQAIIDKMFNSASESVYWLSDDEIEAIGYRPPWLEEWVLAKCPGLLAAENQLMSDPHDATKNAVFKRFSECENGALYDDRRRALNAILDADAHRPTRH